MVHRSHRSGARLRGAIQGLLLLLAVPIAASVVTPIAADPTGNGKEEVAAQLERTDRVIARAIDEVGSAANVLSHRQLGTARDLQARAKQEFSRADPPLKLVLDLTLSAREHALRAIEAARIEARAGESVRRAIDRAQDRVSEVGMQVDQSGNVLARRIFDQGIDQIRRARRAFQSGNLQQAGRLASLALSLIERAGQVAAEKINTQAAAGTSIERTETLLSEVDALLAEIGYPRPETALLAEARHQLDRARDHQRRAQYDRALRFSLRARQKGLDLLTHLRAAPRPEDLQSTLDDLEALAAALAPEIAASGDELAQGRFEEAEGLLGQARRLLSEGKSREALGILVAAEALLREAADAAGHR